jgi:hypothetical protein
MALTATTIATALTAVGNRVKVTTAGTVAAGHFAKINGELCKVMAVNGTLVDLQRGVRGTKALAQGILSSFVYGTAADFAATNTGPTAVADGIYTYGASGAIPVLPGIHLLTSAGALTMTLADPSPAEDGLKMTFVSVTAQTHTVSNAAGSGFDALGASYDVATFGGAIGDNFSVVALFGKWICPQAIDEWNGVTLG